MQMPTVYDDDLLGVNAGPPDPSTRSRVYSIVYPPVGFFPFMATGNGDFHGLYWPIGREESPPLVAYSSHDAYALIPEHGDLPSAARCQLARDEDRKLPDEFKAVLDAVGEPLPLLELEGTVAGDDHRQLLGFDPNSPFRNCAVADLETASGNFDLAEQHYQRAIELIPEYAAAHFGLGYLLRRVRRMGEAAAHLRKSLVCPLAFWGGCFWADHMLPGEFRADWTRKALLWLQQLKEPPDTLHDDPFFAKVNVLRLKMAAGESQDFGILAEIIDSYANRGQLMDAVYLTIAVGDRAAAETTAFRERNRTTPASFAKRLGELLRAAGLKRRAALLDNMISAMEKPEGLHL